MSHCPTHLPFSSWKFTVFGTLHCGLFVVPVRHFLATKIMNSSQPARTVVRVLKPHGEIAPITSPHTIQEYTIEEDAPLLKKLKPDAAHFYKDDGVVVRSEEIKTHPTKPHQIVYLDNYYSTRKRICWNSMSQH